MGAKSHQNVPSPKASFHSNCRATMINSKEKVMSLTARAQTRGAMQLLLSLLDFKMTNMVKVLKTRPSAAARKPAMEATWADPGSKTDALLILSWQLIN